MTIDKRQLRTLKWLEQVANKKFLGLDAYNPYKGKIYARFGRFYATNGYSVACVEYPEYANAGDDAWNNRANDNLPNESDISADGHARNDTEMEDSKNELEADLREWVEVGAYKAFGEARMIEVMHHWLDRQATITEREFWESYANGNQWETHQYEVECMKLRKRVLELEISIGLLTKALMNKEGE